MNVNLLTLLAPPGQKTKMLAGAPHLSFPTGTPTSVNLGDVMFGQLLRAQIQNARVAAPLKSLGSTASQAGQIAGQLSAKITQLLQNGATLEQVVGSLTQSLGSNFLTQLKSQLGLDPNTDARTLLGQLLSQALWPPGNGPPQTAAQQAAALVGRLVQVADALGRVSGNAVGQQHESLGTISDANAGDTPAPTGTNAILQAALAALQTLTPPVSQSPNVSPNTSNTSKASNTSSSSSTNGQPANLAGPSTLVSPPPPPPLQPQLPAQPAPAVATGNATGNANGNANSAAALALGQALAQASDGRTVSANPVLNLVGTGGNTAIGRILARAANVAVSPTATPAQTTPANGTALLQPQLAATATSAASNGPAGDALLAAVLHSLETTLAALPAAKTDTAPVEGSSTGNGTSSFFASLGIGTSLNPTLVAETPAQPAQTQIPSAYVDPNGIVDQVLKGISMQNLADGSQSVRMRLVPENLGGVTVNLQVQNGQVNATLVAQTVDARDTLLANQTTLMRSLEDAGMKLASFTVDLSNGGSQYRQPQGSNQPRFGALRRMNGTASDQADDDVLAAVPTFGPPQSQIAAMQWLNALA